MYCLEAYFVEYTKVLSCTFDAGKHVDSMTIYCEDTEDFFRYVDSEGRDRVGATFLPDFTVRYY